MNKTTRITPSKWNELLGVFSVFWVVVSSGGVFLNSKAVVNFVLVFDVMLLSFLLASIYQKIVRQHLAAVGYFLLLTFVVMLSTIANADLSSLLTYARLILMLLLSMAVALALDKEKILSVFVKTVVVIAAFSVLFFYTGLVEQYAWMFPVIEFNDNNYVNAFVYLHFNSVEPRNFGIFIEPGLYQIYLNMALFVLVYAKKPIRYRYVWIGVLLAALFSTNSTTGFILALVIFAGYAFINERNKYKAVLVPVRIAIVFILIGLVVGSEFFTENIKEKFLFANRLSFMTRLNSTLIDLELVIRNPFFGVGVGNYESNIRAYDAVGLVIDAATNTFSQLAALIGLPFIVIVVVGSCYFIAALKIGRMQKFVLGLMYVVFFSTEPFILYPLFYLPTFMGFNLARQKRLILNRGFADVYVR